MTSAQDLKEVDDLERELAPMAGKPGGDFRTRVAYLRKVRKLKLRRSENVALVGAELLNNRSYRARLGKELWDVYEQVAVAAMDCGSLEVAEACVGSLITRFSEESLRVAKLKAMWHEAKGDFPQAEFLYDNLLEEHPAEAHLHKRKIAMKVAGGDAAGAIEALNKYLETFMGDTDAWRELADIYISLQMYKQAAFCYEELLLAAPLNPIFHLTYAQLLCTIGGLENLRTAKSYYATAIEFSGGKNIRALYGVWLCEAAIKQASKGGQRSRGGGGASTAAAEEERRKEAELPGLAAQVLLREYADRCPQHRPLVEATLGRLAGAKSAP